MAHVRAPAGLEGFVGDVLFHRADGHGAKAALVERAAAFAQAVLRTDPPADFRQAVGLVRHLGRFKEAAFLHQLEPVGNEVVHRALPLAVGVATGQAARRLFLGIVLGKRRVDFNEFALAQFGREFLARIALRVHELEYVSHFDSCPGDGPSSASR